MLVSFFSEQISVVVQHYKSKSFTVVNAKKLYNFVIDTLEADGIQLTNLISTIRFNELYAGYSGRFRNINEESSSPSARY